VLQFLLPATMCARDGVLACSIFALFECCTHFNNHGWSSEAGAGRRMRMIKTVVSIFVGMLDRNLVEFNVAGHVDGRLVMITGSSTPSHVLRAACPSDNRIPSESY